MYHGRLRKRLDIKAFKIDLYLEEDLCNLDQKIINY